LGNVFAVSDLKPKICIKKQEIFYEEQKYSQINMLDDNFKKTTLEKWVAGASPR